MEELKTEKGCRCWRDSKDYAIVANYKSKLAEFLKCCDRKVGPGGQHEWGLC